VKVVVLGATKGMGRAVARRMAERGDELFLLGRDAADLEKTADDLGARSPRGVRPGHAPCDLDAPDGFEAAFDLACAALGRVDTVVVTAGRFATQDAMEAAPESVRAVLDADFTATILFCEAARRRLLAQGGGTLCVFSSVAGDRPRKPVVLYGAAKAGLSAYLDGLDHRFHARGLRVVCVKPGFVRTAMTAGLPQPPFAGEPEGVAKVVVRAIDRGTPVVYAPPIWRLVLFVIRRLPRFVMRRIGF
jgi:NAD(P)-dependent dehydrogenase (short-subunit alcohol dehydrogenase family)